MNSTTLKFKIQEGQLVPATEADEKKLKLFAMSVGDNDTLDAFITVISGDSKTLGQLAKVHVLMKELAKETGHTLDEIKLYVKERAGITEMDDSGHKILKSFADCNKSELSKAIQECIAIGDEIGCYLY